jgi:hypothetical protein
MTKEFPALIYRSPGEYKNLVGTYTYSSVQTQKELDDKLSEGWFASSAEAITAAGDKANGIKKPKPKWAIKATKKKKPSKSLDWRDHVKAQPAPVIEFEPVNEDADPTRDELEAKATELGIRFDGRTKDKKLGQLIQDRLSESTAGE